MFRGNVVLMSGNIESGVFRDENELEPAFDGPLKLEDVARGIMILGSVFLLVFFVLEFLATRSYAEANWIIGSSSELSYGFMLFASAVLHIVGMTLFFIAKIKRSDN